MTRESFDMILRDNRNRVYGHALRCLRDAHDAEDVTQETFLRLWRSAPDVPADRMGPWLIRVVHNLCIDHTRRRQTQRTYLGRPDALALEQLADRPAEETVTEHVGEELLDAMQSLSPQTRSIMLMHYQQGLKLREIADLLDANINSVKVRIHRARRTLRDVLAASNHAPMMARQENGS